MKKLFILLILAAVIITAIAGCGKADKGIYMVSFDSRGAGFIDSQFVTENETAVKPENPVKREQAFKGWFISADFGETLSEEYDFDTPVTANIKLYAKWQKDSGYLITFNNNGGTYTDGIYIKGYETITLPANPKKEGCDFKGWYLESSFINKLVPDTFKNKELNDNITVYAKWSYDDLTVTFDLKNGNEDLVQVVSYGGNAVLPENPVKSGYSFVSWKPVPYLTNITESQTYEAVYQGNNYTVSFEIDDEINKEYDAVVTFGNAYGDIFPSETKDGYDLIWKSGEDEITASSIVEIYENHILHAEWVAKTFTVFFNTGEVPSKIVTYGDVYGYLPPLKTTGYTFAGWYTEADGGKQIKSGTKVEITENITLYAQFVCDFTYIKAEGKVTITGLSEYGATYLQLIIPNAVEEIKNIEIAAGAFTDFEYSFTKIYIPSYVNVIESGAFADVRNLEIYCQIALEDKPEGWEDGWDGGAVIVWGWNSIEDFMQS